jgi:hypothetical protein
VLRGGFAVSYLAKEKGGKEETNQNGGEPE